MGLAVSIIRNAAFLGGLGLIYWGAAAIDPRWAKVGLGTILLVVTIWGRRRGVLSK